MLDNFQITSDRLLGSSGFKRGNSSILSGAKQLCYLQRQMERGGGEIVDQNDGPATYDVTNFTIRQITECGRVIRTIGEGATSMEEVSGRIVRRLYNTLIDGQTGIRACPLVRFFKTHAYEKLDNELKDVAVNMMGGKSAPPEMKCLTLLGTVGENLEWHSRRTSKRHQAIPLDKDAIPVGIALETDLLFSGPFARAHAKQMQQVLTYLIANGWESIGHTTGTVTLATRISSASGIPKSHLVSVGWKHVADVFACLEVTDIGCGIAEA